MRLKIITSMLLTFLAIAVWAKEVADAKIIVWQKDGKTTEILFKQMPEFTYKDGNVSTTVNGVSYSWPLSQLHKFTFEAAPSGTSGLQGDANGDGHITITDAVAVVNYILGNASSDFVKANADVNGDGYITITDAVAIVNIILNQKIN